MSCEIAQLPENIYRQDASFETDSISPTLTSRIYIDSGMKHSNKLSTSDMPYPSPQYSL